MIQNAILRLKDLVQAVVASAQNQNNVIVSLRQEVATLKTEKVSLAERLAEAMENEAADEAAIAAAQDAAAQYKADADTYKAQLEEAETSQASTTNEIEEIIATLNSLSNSEDAGSSEPSPVLVQADDTEASDQSGLVSQ